MLLGGLLFFGVNNAWGTYYVHHNGPLSGGDSWTDKTYTNYPLSQVSTSTVYSRTFNNVEANSEIQFGLKDSENASAWITGRDQSLSNVELSGDNVCFTMPCKANVTISYNTSTSKIYVQVSIPNPVVLTVYITNSAYIYAYGGNYLFNNGWPGKEATSTETVGGIKYYKQTINVQSGTSVNLVFNNNDNSKSEDLSLGAISSATTVKYFIDSECRIPYLAGSFDMTGSTWNWLPMRDGQIVKAMAASKSYEFKIAFKGYHNNNSANDTWKGHNVESTKATITSETTDAVSLNTTDWGSTDEIGFKTTIAGNYTFALAWNGSTPEVSVAYPTTYTRTGLSENKWGTICLPVASSAVSGATIYEITGKSTDGKSLYVSPIADNNALVKGVPYIFKAAGETLTVTLDNTQFEETAGDANGLVGNYTEGATISGAENYVIQNNNVVNVSTNTVNLHANTAYIVLGSVSPTLAPGRPVLEIPMSPNNATNIEAIDASENAVKYIQDGKLYILRDGVTYDAIGRIVK